VSRLVWKVGGSVSAGAATHVLDNDFVDDEIVVVHGAGPQISAEMKRRRLAVRFVRGRRYTTPKTLAVVRDCMRAVNETLCAAIGPRAVGLFGDEIGLQARHVPELGLVGEPLPCAPAAVVEALAAGRIPVIAPLAEGPLNVNADEAASALAVGLGAERIVFLSDVPGVLLDEEVLPSVSIAEAERLLETFEGGIVPKLRAAITAARLGVHAEIGETEVVA
jgi:acetylglutamate kinase